MQMQSWQSYCKNIEGINKMAESRGSRVIFNIAVYVGMPTDDAGLRRGTQDGKGQRQQSAERRFDSFPRLHIFIISPPKRPKTARR
jgi:hypothetical protein